MSEIEGLAAFRWIFLVAAALAVLAGIFFDFLYKHIVEPWIAFNERKGYKVPPSFRKRTFGRAWNFGCAVLFAAAWWCFGLLA